MHDTGANVLLFLRRLLPTESDAALYEGFAMSVIQRYRTRAKVPDQRRMSALGHKRTFAVQNVMSALPPKADMCGATRHVRFVPI